MIERIYRGNFIGGHFVKVTDPNGAVISRNPCNLAEPKVEIPFSYEHIHEAVSSAKRAYSYWKRLGASERYEAVRRYKEVLKSRKASLSEISSFELGRPLWETNQEIDDCLTLIDTFLNQGSPTTYEAKVPEAIPGCEGVTRYFPRGVIAVVSQSLLPLFSTHSLFIPALISGNTVVVKSTKYAPVLCQMVADIAQEAALPAGILNFIQGDGEVARRLTAHSDLDAIFFSGTPETAISIRKQILNEYWKPLVVFSGGKNAVIVWNDSNYQHALGDCMLSAYTSAGQRATSANRFIVHEKIYDQFVKDFHTLSKKCKIGSALLQGENAPLIGSLVSENAVEDYVRYQGIAIREGCEEVMRGKTLERDTKGYFVSPSIHLVESPDKKSVYQTTEFFGPNVAIYKVSEIDEATEIVNLTPYGLVTSIYSGSREVYLRVVEDAQVGIVHWNFPTTRLSYRLPIGGLKKSGNGRLLGSFAGYQCTYPVSAVEAPINLAKSFWPSELPLLEK